MGAGVDISKLFNPRSIAIVGASPRASSAGGAVMRTLSAVGFTGAVYPINPRYSDVFGLPCYASLADIPDPVDAVFVGLAAEASVSVVREAAERGARAIEIHAGGFADGGASGKRLQAQITAIAREFGIALCGPNNMGLLNLHDRTGMWPIPPERLEPGPVAILSQSGSAAMVLGEDPKGLGLAYIVTSGNEAGLTIADYLDYVVRDERVRLVLLFVEAIRDPPAFAAAAREAAARGTRLIAVKLGTSESAQAAIAAHTNAVAGSDRVTDAFLRDCGVVRVRDVDEMLETAQLFRLYPDPPRAPGVVALTMSGGEAALVGDLASTAGVSLPALRKATRTGLQQDLAAFSLPNNPLDAWGLGWDVDRFRLAIERLLGDGGVSTIVAALDAPASGGCDTHIAHEIVGVFASLMPATSTRFVIVNNTAAAGTDPDLVSLAASAGIPCLVGMRPAIAAIGHWVNHTPGPARRVATRRRSPSAQLRRRVSEGSLSGLETSLLLHDAGIPMVQSHTVSGADEAVRVAERLGYPVVMKGDGAGLLHKTEGGLVKLMLSDANRVRDAFAELTDRLALGAVVEPAITIEPQEHGLELAIGIRRDPAFGLVTMAGLGGIHLEFVREVSVRVGAVNRRRAREMFSETLAGTFLAGVRGGAPLDAAAAANAVADLWSFAASLEDVIASVEINPLLVRERGQGVVGVDAVLVNASRDST